MHRNKPERLSAGSLFDELNKPSLNKGRINYILNSIANSALLHVSLSYRGDQNLTP